MTYRILIVDDEYYIRQRVKLCIPWEDYGFKCVAEAQSFEEALDYLTSNQIDLILVDISMPGHNGLELIREAHALYPRINFIILSGFSTFAYAKEALKYDVAEYLLKPINTEELIRTLSSIKQRLDCQMEDDAHKQEYRYFKEMYQLSENNTFFRDLLSGRVSTTADLSLYGLIPSKSYLLLIADIQDTAASSHMLNYSRRLKLRNIFLKFWAPYNVAYVFTDYHDRQIFVCDLALIMTSLHELLTAIEQIVIEQLQLPLFFGYHEVASGTAEQFRIAYRLGMNRFLFRAIYGCSFDEKSSVAISDNISMKKLPRLEEHLRICLYAENRSGVFLNIKEIFSLLRQETPPIQILEGALLGIFTIAIQYAISKQLNYLFDLENERISLDCTKMVEIGSSLKSIEQQLLALLLSLMQQPEDTCIPCIQIIVQQAADIIRKEFRRPDLGLAYIAEALIISPSYLSRNFSKFQGMSLTQYIINCRMGCAECLLAESDMSISQIAQNVGYNDVLYFSKLFKKEFGIAPSHYRNTKR